MPRGKFDRVSDTGMIGVKKEEGVVNEGPFVKRGGGICDPL